MEKYEENLFEDIRSTRDQVGYILKKYVETRNSDPELVKRVAQHFGHDPLEIFETVRRSRQWYQEEKRDKEGNLVKEAQYLPTEEKIARQRRINMEVWKAAFGYKNSLF